MEKELPLLLAGEFLGEIPPEKVAEVKAEIASLGQFLADAPIIIKGFQAMQTEIAGRHARNLNMLARRKAEKDFEEETPDPTTWATKIEGYQASHRTQRTGNRAQS